MLRVSLSAGVLKEEERLADLFGEHVTGPAAEAAEPARSSYGAQSASLAYAILVVGRSDIQPALAANSKRG